MWCARSRCHCCLAGAALCTRVHGPSGCLNNPWRALLGRCDSTVAAAAGFRHAHMLSAPRYASWPTRQAARQPGSCCEQGQYRSCLQRQVFMCRRHMGPPIEAGVVGGRGVGFKRVTPDQHPHLKSQCWQAACGWADAQLPCSKAGRAEATSGLCTSCDLCQLI